MLSINIVPETAPSVRFFLNLKVMSSTVPLQAALSAYRFNDAANLLYAFVWGKVCDWYVEFSKPLLSGEDEAARAETQATMAWVMDQCLILLHPIMPFITEELWGSLTKRETVLIHTDWPSYSSTLIDTTADKEMNWVIGLIEEIRSVRAQMHVPRLLQLQTKKFQ